MRSCILRRTCVTFAGFALALLVGWTIQGADDPKADPKSEVKRTKPWITSKVTGSPEPPPKFKAVRVFPEVKFNHGLLIAHAPGSDRFFVGEQEGFLYSVANKPDAKKEVFFDLRKELKSLDKTPLASGIGELYGLVFHPKFEENRFCYVCYTLNSKDPKKPHLPDGTRVSRFNVTKADPPRIDPASEEIIITFQGGGHNGGDLHFGQDGMLYISTGDGSGPNPPDVLNTGQDCSDLLSSILRIDVDHQDKGKQYSVPKDNPFVKLKDVRPEIWAFGFRNPWRMSFDRKTGDLWVGDVGWELWEMVDKVQKGGNYGWSIVEGRQPIKPNQKIGPSPILAPTIELPHTIACSVTGGYVYRGKKFPELVGAYIFGDWETRRIWAARFENDRVKEMPEITKLGIRVVAFGEDHAGELFFLDYDTGYMYTLERNDLGSVNAKFPTKLSDTGIFTDTKKQTPAEGVVPFKPNLRQWQDGATAEYFLALPGTSSVTLFDKPRQLPGQVFWHEFKMQFPKDAVLVKTLSTTVTPGGAKRIETQILHCDGEDWRGYSYMWRTDQSDADLVPAEGAEKLLTVADDRVSGGKREQVWTFHSRTQCMVCHSSWAEYALAFSPGQLNGGYVLGTYDDTEKKFKETSRVQNELIALSKSGHIRRVDKDDKELPPFDETSVGKQPVIAGVLKSNGSEFSIEDRARAYLHVNCAHCHRFGGGGGQVVLEMDVSKPLKEMGILDVAPKQGDFGIQDARIIAPGDPTRSVHFYRKAKFGKGHMPHIGAEMPPPALDLMYRWICELGGKDPTLPSAALDTSALEKNFTNPKTALPYAQTLRRSSFSDGDRDRILAAAQKVEPGPVRDLFDGYFPPDPKGRKLGPNPRPAVILALTGDAKKGETIFFNKEMKCASCHKVGDKGVALGPDLSTIGKTRSRPDLLESLLQPSLRVEPQYAAYIVRTKDEKTVTGILVKRDEKQVVVRDAENKEHTFAAADVASVTPSRLSLMPEGQMAALTPQEAADLLEYLVQRK
jgi:putative heme-binding domain-containing protein